MLLAGILTAAAHAAQPIRGFVVDGTSGEPLPIANVTLTSQDRGSATNLDGFFTIPALTPGTYTLRVSYLGYHTQEREVTVTDEVMDPITVELLPASVELEEVTFTVSDGEEELKRESPRTSTVPVDGSTIRQIPSLGAEMDVLRAIQAIPGVKASSEISSALYVRGGSPDMTLILMDQSTVYNPSHLFGLFSTFNADAVKRIELMKGGFPAEYGGRAGSVLEVVTDDGNRREYEGLVSIGMISARGSLEGPLPGNAGSFALSGRRTYFEPLINALRESSDEFADLPDYYFYDGNAKVNLDLTQNTVLTLGGYWGNDDFGAEFGSDDARMELNANWGNKTFTSRLRQVVGSHSFVTASFAFSRYNSGAEFWDRDEQEGNDYLIQGFENHFDDMAIRADYEYHGIRNHKIKTGVQASRYDVDVFNGNQDATFAAIDTATWNYSWYVQDQWKLGSQFEILPGSRVYLNKGSGSDGDLIAWDPRFSMVYHYNPETRFKFSTGRYHQFVNIASAGEGLSFFDMWFPSDNSVYPTNSWQYVLGFEWDFAPEYEFTFETYYNNYQQILLLDQRIDRGTSVEDAFLEGKGHSYGFEFMLRKKMGRLSGWMGYSLSWSKRRFPGEYINDGQWFYPKWDRRHDFIAVGTYNLSKHFDISAQWRYNTGQGYTRGVGVYSLRHAGVGDDFLHGDGRTILKGSKNNYRFPADHRLDVTVDYKHTFFGNPAKLSLSVYNAYNRRALWQRIYDTSQNPVEHTDVKLLPILPLIGYEVRF